MSLLQIKSSESCAFDLLSLGEVMLRLDPGEGRVRCAREFKAWEGGGEYNVARGLRRCFGMRAAAATALVDNDVGRLIEDFILQGGVDTRFIQWVPYDGVGRTARNGLNFTERGFGVRGARGVYDRGHTAASQLKPGDFDWDHIFGRLAIRWFHTGGIFAALGETTPALVIEAVSAARRHGVIVSYDLNYRPSLWKAIGGEARAREVNQAIAPEVDVMIGHEDHLTACLGIDGGGSVRKAILHTMKQYPNLKVIAATQRTEKSANRNDWSAICRAGGAFHEAPKYENLDILDRVGGGDSFAAGLIYGFLRFNDAQKAIDYGAAHGALAMTTPGDTSMASLAEVESLVAGTNARVQR